MTVLVNPVELSGSARGLCRVCDGLPNEEVIEYADRATVFASYGALVDGWVLVAPVRHVLATAELTDVEWRDFLVVMTKWRSVVEANYGPVVLFEHGSAGSGREAGCGVDHAHIHIVPADLDLRASISRLPSRAGTSPWVRAGARPEKRDDLDYVWISDQTGQWIQWSDRQPSQLVRRAIANELGVEAWDWKLSPRRERARATRQALLSAAGQSQQRL